MSFSLAILVHESGSIVVVSGLLQLLGEPSVATEKEEDEEEEGGRILEVLSVEFVMWNGMVGSIKGVGVRIGADPSESEP